jgi:hypothetical protein
MAKVSLWVCSNPSCERHGKPLDPNEEITLRFKTEPPDAEDPGET